MPLAAITDLSDDERSPPKKDDGVKPNPSTKKDDGAKKVTEKPSKSTKKEGDPEPVVKPKAEPKPKVKATVKPKQEPAQKSSGSTLKRPAAKVQLKKPAASVPARRAYKYLYHKKGMYGIKVDKKEVLAV